MNIFQLSISTFVFAITLLLGTTAVVASRFVVATVANLYKPATRERVVAPAAEPERVVDLPDLRNEPPPAPDDFDPSGPYVLDAEKVPAAFADVDWIDIVTHRYVEDNETYINQPIIPTGSLQTPKKSFEFKKVAVGNREISFETTTIDGVRYTFVGHFLISTEHIACEDCEYPADLTGKLKKLKNGRVIAEVDAKFYIAGC
jgi:hypothetical protein